MTSLKHPRALLLFVLVAGLCSSRGLGGASDPVPTPAPAKQTAPQSGALTAAPDLSSLDAVLTQELKDTNTPGAALAVIRGDRVIYAKGYGVASVDAGGEITPDTLFRLGSTTKMLTAAAVVSLAEAAKLKLDAPISSYVSGLDPSIGRLTAHQLLSHSAGLRDDAVMNGLHDDAALAAGVKAMTRDMFFAEPGRLFSYANPGYWIAGLLAETVDGRPYADVMAARLFEPLGMTRTTLRPTMAMTWPLAQGHDLVSGKPAVIRPAADNVANWPAGSVFSSVNDLSRWVIAFLNGGRVDGRQAVAASVFTTLATPRIDQPGTLQPKYGYGVTLVTRRGVRLIQHNGSRAGYGSAITMAPDQRIGIIVLANRTGVDLPKTMAKAAELLLPLEPEAQRKPRPAMPMTAAESARYAGVYAQQAADPGTTVLAQGTGLALRTGTADTPIVKVGDNAFEIHRASGTVEDVWFVLGPDGRAAFLYRGTRAHPRR